MFITDACFSRILLQIAMELVEVLPKSNHPREARRTRKGGLIPSAEVATLGEPRLMSSLFDDACKGRSMASIITFITFIFMIVGVISRESSSRFLQE